MIQSVKKFLSVSHIQKIWSDYEQRSEQLTMAEKVAFAFESDDNLIVEAGTGVGKSLAYLLPAALFSIKNKRRVVISTDTKALQNQLLYKDIPQVSKIIGQPINAQLALGASNYVCKRKLDYVFERGAYGPEMTGSIQDFLDWERETSSGIKSEYKGYASPDFWSKITREGDNCLGGRCPNFSRSYYFLEREKWRQSNLLIVNHHLLSSHIAGEFAILPEFSHVIIDEAHTFPEILGESFGAQTTYEDSLKLLEFLESKDRKTGLVTRLKSASIATKISRLIGGIGSRLIEYFMQLRAEFDNVSVPKRLTSPPKAQSIELEKSLKELIDSLELAKKDYNKESESLQEQEAYLELDMCQNRFSEVLSIISGFRLMDDKELVYWLEPPAKGSANAYPGLCSQLLRPHTVIKDKFLKNMDTVIFTSATLSSGNSFEYFKKSLGNPEIEEVILSSPFNYSDNSIVYIPKNLHDPGSENDEYHQDIIKLIPDLLRLTNGNAFVLFTSNKSLQIVYDALKNTISYPVFSQLEIGSDKAKEKFLSTDNSVLFGVSTFWQGIDIKGSKLQSVIIAKIPFQPPARPVLEARIEDLRRNNGNPFMEIQLPEAILVLKQGFGRLIRSYTDTGIVSILDPRIKTKRYGEQILEALPPAKKVFSLKELKEVFAKLPKYE